eukprot:SAG31_NODE_3398_length_4315_cov_1.326850_2_plen_81_part_00
MVCLRASDRNRHQRTKMECHFWNVIFGQELQVRTSNVDKAIRSPFVGTVCLQILVLQGLSMRRMQPCPERKINRVVVVVF